VAASQVLSAFFGDAGLVDVPLGGDAFLALDRAGLLASRHH
jgi:hypothetical protein